MTGLNNVMRTMTGPVRLRSQLRQRAAPVHALLTALDRPAEVKMRIPAGVLGGDIFAVMSKHIREKLEAESAAEPSIGRVFGKRSRRLAEEPGSKDSRRGFPFVNPEELHNSPAFARLVEMQPELRSEFSSAGPSPEASVREDLLLPFVVPTAEAEPGLSLPDSERVNRALAPSDERIQIGNRKVASTGPGLVGSLKRYWELIREAGQIQHVNPVSSSERLITSASLSPIASFESGQTERRFGSVGREVAGHLRAFVDRSEASFSVGPQTVTSAPERVEIQNVFNIEIKKAEHGSRSYDDLGDRIAGILHEQALQHGIDVT